MENVALLIGFLLHWAIPFATVLWAIILWTVWRRPPRPLATYVVLGVLLAGSILILGSDFLHRQEAIDKAVGMYRLGVYRCEECPDCEVVLKRNGSYVLTRRDSVLREGDWDFRDEYGAIYLEIEGGSGSDFLDSTRTLSSIGNEGCQTIWRRRNLEQALDGVVESVSSEPNYIGMAAFRVRNLATGMLERYDPRYIGHPWLTNRIAPGMHVIKHRGSMEFYQVDAAGDTILIATE